jgi:hypothetical protein
MVVGIFPLKPPIVEVESFHGISGIGPKADPPIEEFVVLQYFDSLVEFWLKSVPPTAML